MNYDLAYLFGTLFILGPIWLATFWYRKDLRKEILTTSFVIGVVGVLSEFWYNRDYWNPEVLIGKNIGIEDFLFGFFIGGITSVIYEVLFGKHFAKRRNKRHHWKWFVIPFLILFLVILNTSVFFLKINSIYSSIIGFLALAFILWLFRPDLVADSLLSGVLFGAVMFVGYIIFLYFYPEAITRWWQLKNITGLLFNGIPIEELMWAFSWGMFGGPMYEFFHGMKFK